MSLHNRKVRPHTGRSGVSQSGRRDKQAPPVTDSDSPAASAPADNSEASTPADSAATEGTDSDTAGHNNTDGRGPALIGPTSEATRRWVAESRMRQGLSPRITDPVVLDSLALFLRNAIDSLDRDRRRRDDT
ncbi:hypothetical protein QX204_24615 [Nocardia sp. PE-7]|uniref:hypothetical protein n=1 Tax=Nocardia sp. PE-7 TaxID=3058426 RepID=UPI0026580A09|nr:hypothetical protein [Nocardia sp. PE-7]WKG08225.1 hypothetical protein QX204_24615 [Nocardia sp. PE-7]